jgi:ankyrin repeat protein
MGSTMIKAIKRCDHDARKAEIESGAPLHAVDSQGWTPLFHAAHRGDVTAVTMLLQAGADVNHGIERGFTALFSAVMSLHVEVVRTLLNAGAKTAPVQGVDLHHHVQRRQEPRSLEIIALLDKSVS